jgi:hypothetical protein
LALLCNERFMIMMLTSAIRFCIPLHILCNSDISGTCYGMCTMCWLSDM